MNQFTHGGNVSSYDHIRYDFSANLNPLGMPPKVVEALRQSWVQCDRYPDPMCRALRKKLGEMEHTPPDTIVCGNGAADLIYRLVHLVQPKEGLVLSPTFSEYEEAMRSVGCRVRYHHLEKAQSFRPDQRLLQEITPSLDCCFLCNPNNPTGVVMERPLLEQLAAVCQKQKVLLVMDECFLDFTEGYSVKGLLGDNPYLVVLRATTKTFAMAGLRLGYCITENKALRTGLLSGAQPWSVSTPAQIAGIAAAGEQDYLAQSVELITEQRAILQERLSKLGVRVYPSEANYLLLESQLPLFDRLLERGILIRHCDNYVGLGQDFYRIAVRTPKENQVLIEALEEICCG